VRQAIANTLQYNDEDLTSSSKIAIQGAEITTLTGAMTAQNLASFSKNIRIGYNSHPNPNEITICAYTLSYLVTLLIIFQSNISMSKVLLTTS
jgi:hypothetical protein